MTPDGERPGSTIMRLPTVLGELQARVSGAGPAMLLRPSLLMTGGMWVGQVEHFRDRFTVIQVDPPGHGASEP